MQFTRILAVALMLTLGAGAAFAQDGERKQRPDRERKERPEGERKERPEGERGDHAKKHALHRQVLKGMEARLELLKAKQAKGDAEDPERLAEAIAKLEARIAKMKEKGAEHMEKHHKGKGQES